MQPLDKTLRNRLERTIKDARELAESAARAALEQLGVAEPAPFPHLSEQDRELRRKLRVHGSQLGDTFLPSTSGRGAGGEGRFQALDHLIEEVAYEHWHRMLFARFLAENNLLMYLEEDLSTESTESTENKKNSVSSVPSVDPNAVAVTLEECADLAADEGLKNEWEMAAKLASRMLPQIFRLDSPVFQLVLPPEHQQKLERLVADLELSVFTASDSLGWVYQFWQAKKKDEVNASEVKIGARELPAVTQLFTEPYMVSFLLDNSLGAWWAARRLTEADLQNAGSEQELRRKAAIPGVPLDYLRFVKVEAASSRFPEMGYFQKDKEIANLSGNLPHWRQDSVTYFVTFRTADSLPQEKLTLWQTEKDEWLEQHPEPHDEKTKREFYEKFPDRIQKWLDQGYGECLLKNSEYKTIVDNALKHFDGDRYDLDEFVVMPNHVHVVVTPKIGYALSSILHSWKSFTASEINKKIGKSGSFWQKESFDHIVRSPEQLEQIRAYICNHSAYDGKRLEAASTLSWTPAAGTFDGWPEQLADLKTLDPCCGSGHFLVAAFLMLVPIRMERDGLSAREAVDAVLRENIHGLELDQRCVELAAFALALTAWKYPDLPSPFGRGAGGEGGTKPIGYRPLPELNVACSGLSVSVAKEEWKQLAMGKHNLRIALDWMHDIFKDAPVLGSLLNPAKTDAAKLVQWDELSSALEQALKTESTENTEKEKNYSVSSVPSVDEKREVAVVAQGLAKAATLLAGRYQWVITNVPYLARGKQNERLRDFCERHYPAAKNDLATVFLDRCLELCAEGSTKSTEKGKNYSVSSVSSVPSVDKNGGVVSVVLPQNWLFLTSYKKFREKLLKNDTWHLIARLGPGAFETISGEVVKAILISLSRGNARKASGGLFGSTKNTKSTKNEQDLFESFVPFVDNKIRGLDVSEPRTAAEKAAQLLTAEIKSVGQAKQLENPDASVMLEEAEQLSQLSKYARSVTGLQTGDDYQYARCFWELCSVEHPKWLWFQGAAKEKTEFTGKSRILRWGGGNGSLADNPSARVQGQFAWDKKGISVQTMRELNCCLFQLSSFDMNASAIIPKNQEHVSAVWSYISSPDYQNAVRKINQKLRVADATLVKVPFALDRWSRVAAEKYPNGLPKPYTDDPTQWIFHGHPCGSVIWDEEQKWAAHGPLRTDDSVLHIAIARLLGYRWPAELEYGSTKNTESTEKEKIKNNSVSSVSSVDKKDSVDKKMELSEESLFWVKQCEQLLPLADEDGIVCIPPVRGEHSAADRLLNLLANAHSQYSSFSNFPCLPCIPWTETLLKNADHAGKTLESWLREKFFTQHCKLFQHRPFIWHIWDGLRDGFAALVNYHKLDAKLLETLIYTYLGDWISRQKQDIACGVDGAQERLAAAESLKKKLELILIGEAPYDIFVRWKPLEKQPIGWDPDPGDGVRLNIRPFMTVPDVGKKGAGCLRDKPNIKWGKDRGKDVVSAPWYHVFKGDRINDHHLSLAEKRRASTENTEGTEKEGKNNG